MEKITSAQNNTPSPEQEKKKYKRWGLWSFIGPWVVIIGIIVIWGIINVLSGALGSTSPVFKIINILVPLLLTISIICIFVGIPIGIYYRRKAKRIGITPFDERSGKGEQSIVPEEIKGWSWGAFSLNWIWGLSHGVWISLLCFIPFVSVIMAIVLGIKGREWAWKKQKWESIESFKKTQKNWDIVGGIILALGVTLSILSIVSGIIAG